MSIGVGDLTAASDPGVAPPYSREQVALSDWPGELKRAWETFHSVEEGDMVRWADKKQGLEVKRKFTNDDGFVRLEVEGPLGGTYEVREAYDEGGNPRYYADDSSATNLHELDAPEPDATPLTETMYDSLVRNLSRVAIGEWVDTDTTYDSFPGAVDDVVRQWADDVSYHRWRGWPYDWDDDTPEYIFRMVREHAGELPETALDPGDSTTPKHQAIEVLTHAVIEEGRQQAHARLIDTQGDYDAHVQELADAAVERDKRKATISAREAAREVAEDFVDAHTEPVWRAIIEHGYAEPMELEMYEGTQMEEVAKEMAFDILQADVWERAREEHQAQGTHDPTVRGLMWHEYDGLVETLTEEALREHRLNDNTILFTTVKKVVTDFADDVEAHDWDYDVGGIGDSTEILGDSDVEDIFTSITMHSETEPQIFNPFARDKERKLAVQVLTEDIHERASAAIDRGEIMAEKPVPAEEYLEAHLGEEVSFSDIREDTGLPTEDFVAAAIENVDETENLAGWTFVDELVDTDALVPYMAGEWVLVDYGLVRLDTVQRRAAWFNRDNGSVLVLTGEMTNLPTEGSYGFENDAWHLILIPWDADGTGGEEYIVRDTDIETAFLFARDFMGADETDIQVIETADGRHYIQEAINHDDINPSSLIPDIGQSFNLPGPFTVAEDAFAYGGEQFLRLGRWIRNNSKLVDAAATTATLMFLGEVAHMMNRVAPGLNIQAYFNKKKGAGIKGSYNFGQEFHELEQYDPSNPDDYFYRGELKGDVTITPGALRHIGTAVSPEWLYTTGSSTTSVVGTLADRVEEPIRRQTGDYLRGPRAVFLAAHLPAIAPGRPEGIEDYAHERKVDIAGREMTLSYNLDPGETLDDVDAAPSKRSLLRRLAANGYMVEHGQYYWDGDERVRDRLDVKLDKQDALTPVEVQELAWSLERGDVLGTRNRRLIGDIDEVEEHYNSDTGPVCTHRAFLKIYTDLPNTPSKTMLSVLWEYYQARSEESDDFTMLDAYQRFRSALVYDHTADATEYAIREYVADAAESGEDELRDIFKTRTDRVYYWNAGGELRAENVFGHADAVPRFILFDYENRPPDEVEHYFHNKNTGEYVHNVNARTQTPIEKNDLIAQQDYDDPYYTDPDDRRVNTYSLRTWADVEDALTSSARRDLNTIIADEHDDLTIYVDESEYDPETSEEDRKFISADEASRIGQIKDGGDLHWDDLAGTDLSPLGLFLRGATMEDVVKAADHWRLEDRFQTRASAVLPSNFRPTRTDIPDFQSWFDKRSGELTDKARAKATYLREIAATERGPDLEEVLGVSREVTDDIEERRKIQEHYEETDPYNLDAYYGDEFGEAFDDVAEKFNEQRKYDEGQVDRPDSAE